MLSKEKILKMLEEAKSKRDENFIFESLWDIMYRQLMGSKPGMPVLEVITAVFSRDPLDEVKGKVKLLTTDLLQNRILDKNSKSDIVTSYRDNKYIMEMNSSTIMITRNTYYAYKMASSGLKIGKADYSKAYNTILINFNKIENSNDDLCEMITLRYPDGRIYDDSIKIFSINMAKALDESYNYKSEEEKIIGCVCRILSTNDSSVMLKEALKIMSKEEANNLVERAKELSSDSEMIEFYDNKNFYELVHNTELKQSREDGIKEGLEQGSKEKAIEVAKNGITIGLKNEEISKLTGLSIEEIETLR